MSGNVRCIFCGETKKGSKEHIIPLALGNKDLVISSVCKSCNDRLGETVDSLISNNFLVQIRRQALGLKGNSGTPPNPFQNKNGVDQEGNKVKLDDEFGSHFITQVEKTSSRLHIRTESRSEAKTIASKTLKRSGFPPAEIEKAMEIIDTVPIHKYQPEVAFPFTINLNELFLSATKMAYEYGFYKLGEVFLNDNFAQEMRSVLLNAMNKDFSKKYARVNILDPCFYTAIELAKHNYGKVCHLMVLSKDATDKLIVSIILFLAPCLSFSVCISDSASKYGIAESLIELIDIT